MIVRLLRALMAGVIFSFATAAHAQETYNLPNPWYIAVGAGGAWYEDWELTGTANADIDDGFTGNTAFGRYLDDIMVIRLEAELLYDRGTVNSIGGTSASGTLSNFGAMFNAYYDIRTGTNWTPYLGGGLGYSQVDLDGLSQGGVLLVDDNDGAFSWQIKAGVTYQISPTWAVNVGYRYYGTENLTFKTPAGLNFNTEGTRIHNAEVGFRVHF